jgi:transcriptional regulator with XRE-family HTH domain
VGEANLQALIAELVRRYGSLRALATRLGMSPSRFSRLARGGEGNSLEVVNCLRLAELTGESASRILRLAGKADVADLIERLYGPTAIGPSSNKEIEQLLDAWTDLLPGTRDALLSYIKTQAQLDRVHQNTARRSGGRSRAVR